MVKNYTDGSVTRTIISISFSCVFSMLTYYVYSLTDSLMLSRLVNVDALGAVNAISPASALIECFITNAALAFSIEAGKKFGANDLIYKIEIESQM